MRFEPFCNDDEQQEEAAIGVSAPGICPTCALLPLGAHYAADIPRACNGFQGCPPRTVPTTLSTFLGLAVPERSPRCIIATAGAGVLSYPAMGWSATAESNGG